MRKTPAAQRPRMFTAQTDAWRGTGPRPTVRGWRFFIVARGPVPRDLSPLRKTPAAQRPRMVVAQTGAWRGTGPRPTVKCRFLRCYRSAGACPPRSLNLGMARDRPSPYGEEVPFFYRSAGACPPRSLNLGIARGTRSHARVACEGPRPT